VVGRIASAQGEDFGFSSRYLVRRICGEQWFITDCDERRDAKILLRIVVQNQEIELVGAIDET
jgi:hypothetical protein